MLSRSERKAGSSGQGSGAAIGGVGKWPGMSAVPEGAGLGAHPRAALLGPRAPCSHRGIGAARESAASGTSTGWTTGTGRPPRVTGSSSTATNAVNRQSTP